MNDPQVAKVVEECRHLLALYKDHETTETPIPTIGMAGWQFDQLEDAVDSLEHNDQRASISCYGLVGYGGRVRASRVSVEQYSATRLNDSAILRFMSFLNGESKRIINGSGELLAVHQVEREDRARFHAQLRDWLDTVDESRYDEELLGELQDKLLATHA